MEGGVSGEVRVKLRVKVEGEDKGQGQGQGQGQGGVATLHRARCVGRAAWGALRGARKRGGARGGFDVALTLVGEIKGGSREGWRARGKIRWR